MDVFGNISRVISVAKVSTSIKAPPSRPLRPLKRAHLGASRQNLQPTLYYVDLERFCTSYYDTKNSFDLLLISIILTDKIR